MGWLPHDWPLAFCTYSGLHVHFRAPTVRSFRESAQASHLQRTLAVQAGPVNVLDGVHGAAEHPEDKIRYFCLDSVQYGSRLAPGSAPI